MNVHERTFGSLRIGDVFEFDKARMSIDRANNRPSGECIKESANMFRNGDGTLLIASRADSVIFIRRLI